MAGYGKGHKITDNKKYASGDNFPQEKIMEEQEIKEKKDRRGITALFIPAGLFVGMGVGFLTDKFVPGMYIGLGTGFVLFIISFLLIKK